MYTRQQILHEIERALEMEEGTLVAQVELSGLKNWDSLAVIDFIAMMDSKFSTRVSHITISNCITVNDLCNLLGAKLSD